jgi:hypothetical protein
MPPTARRHPWLPLRAVLCQRAGRDEGMLFSIEQRDVAIDLKSTSARST